MISIITTAFNYARYLPDLAKSIFEQTHTQWEWIIVDDASTDNTEEVVQCDIMPMSRPVGTSIVYIQLKENRGYSAAKNVGIRAAKGDYFVMIDADDMLTPVSLYVRYAAMQTYPEKLWVHGEALNINLQGEIEDVYIQWNKKRRADFETKGMDLTKWYHHRLVHAQTVMVRRSFHKVLGLYDENLRFSSDNEMWRRAIRFGLIPHYIDIPVAYYRVHGKRMSRSEFKRKNLARIKTYIIDIVERRFNEGLEATGTPQL